jgi:integrase
VGAAGWCFKQGDVSMGLSLLVSFQCLLRTVELFLLQKQHIVVASDRRSAVLSLGYTKSGKRIGETEHVTLDDTRLVRLLSEHLGDKEPHYLLIGRSPSQWRSRFNKVMGIFSIHKKANFKPYSLRRGGATHLYSTTLNLSLLTTRGRWASAPTARLYVDEATVQLNALALDAADRKLCQAFKEFIPC